VLLRPFHSFPGIVILKIWVFGARKCLLSSSGHVFMEVVYHHPLLWPCARFEIAFSPFRTSPTERSTRDLSITYKTKKRSSVPQIADVNWWRRRAHPYLCHRVHRSNSFKTMTTSGFCSRNMREYFNLMM
jgi:hypothetical protein